MRSKISKNKVKVEHLRKLQTENNRSIETKNKGGNESTVAPRRLSEYSSLKIFGTAKDLPPRQPPVGPFICAKDLKLSNSEIRILSKEPKYSLMLPPSRLEFDTEIEKSQAKHRYDQQELKKNKRN